MPDDCSGANGTAGIAGSRLNRDVLERSFTEDSAVCDAVQRDATGETEVLFARFAMQRARETQDDFFGHDLDRSRDVHLSLREGALGLSTGAAEQPVEAMVRHRE